LVDINSGEVYLQEEGRGCNTGLGLKAAFISSLV